MPEGEREIYEMKAVILVLAYDEEDAKEMAEKQIVIDDLLEGPHKMDWSHLKPEFGDPQIVIDKVTWEIKRREK